MGYNVFNVTEFILIVIEMFTTFFLMSILLNKKQSVIKIFLCAFCFTCIYDALKLFLPHYVGWIICVVIGIPILSISYKEKPHNILLSWLITGVICAIVDCIVSYSMLAILEVNSFEEIVQNKFYYIPGKLILASVVFVISGFIYYSKIDKFTSKFHKNLGAFLNIVVTFLLLLPNIIMLIYYHDKKTLPFGMVIINICAIIILFFVNMYNTNNNIKLAKSEQDLIAQQKYSKTQQDLIDGLRTFKHDYSNTLQTMYGYVQYNKIDKLKEMFTQVLDETKAITTLDKLNPNTIKDPGLFGILNGKYQKAKENKIKMEVEIFGEIDGIDIDIFDLTRMLGILLDNAIEAAKNSKKKKLTFMLTERKDEVSFEITNTFFEKNIDVKKIKEKGFSSKGKNRGLGLYKVEEIINKYDSVENTTQIEGDLFIQTLTISKSEILANK